MSQSIALGQPSSSPIETDIPGRMDALPWSRWHVLIVLALGITWVLDGLEVTLAGAVGSTLMDPHTLGLSDFQVGLSATCYLAGAVVGALGFGYATDRFGRKKLFFITLAVYVAATAATALSWNAWSYFLFRALTGAGIGGEYAAVNSAIDELIPARVARPRRSADQLDLLDRRRLGFPGDHVSVGTVAPADQPGLADGVRHWRTCWGWASSCSATPCRKAPAG